MTEHAEGPGGSRRQDANAWAPEVPALRVRDVPPEAINLNVEGHRLMGPLQGFGPLWQKTYRIALRGAAVTPSAVIALWKQHFAEFWPAGNRFFAPLSGIAPGEVALLNLTLPGGGLLSTGVMVLYADDESFTFMTPEGHMFSGWITFSAFVADGCTWAQAHVLMRADDPLFEIGMRLGGHRMEDESWAYTLRQLALRFGVEAPVETRSVLLDPHCQWTRFGNIRQNSAIRSMVQVAAAHVPHQGRRHRRRSQEATQ